MIRAITRFSVISNQDLSTKMLSLLVHIIIWIHNEAKLATKPEWVFYVRTGYADELDPSQVSTIVWR